MIHHKLKKQTRTNIKKKTHTYTRTQNELFEQLIAHNFFEKPKRK